MTLPMGIVLAGGRSTRLGRDKACLHVQPGQGDDLLCSSVRLLQGVLGEDRVAVVGRDVSTHPSLHRRGNVGWHLDEVPGKGPMGGVLTALDRYKCSCLVISCDMPFLSAPVLNDLLELWARREPSTLMTTYRQPGTGYLESLTAVYEYEACERLREHLAGGWLRLSGAFEPHEVCSIEYGAHGSRPFFNVNTPDDVRWMRSDEVCQLARHSWPPIGKSPKAARPTPLNNVERPR